MKRFFNNSYIYNQHDIIKNTFELGVNLFRKYADSYLFKSLIYGRGIDITESDNFIKISAEQSTTDKEIIISGLTQISKPIFQVKSRKPIFLKITGCIGDDTYINISSRNDEYIGIHTHDDLFEITYDDENGLLLVMYKMSNKFFTLVINIYSSDSLEYNSIYNNNNDNVFFN